MPKADLHVKIDQQLKAALEREAANSGTTFPIWIRTNLPRLVKEYPDRVIVEESGPFPPPLYEPVAPPQQSYPYYNYPRPQRRYQYPYQMKEKSPLDKMLEDMTKMVQVKMFKDLLQGTSSAEEFVRAARGDLLASKGKNDGFDMNAWMKWSMIQGQQEMQMVKAQQALEAARSSGDKAGENTALNMITALSTANMQQSQQFMQQLMATQATQSQSQQNLFTAALASNKEAGREASVERTAAQQRFDQMRTDMFTMQLANTRQLQELQIDSIKKEMTLIAQKGDWLSQMDKLLALRGKSPIYKAAFDAAFNIKDESTIGKILPQLKELGLDKFLEKVGGYLAQMVTRPKVPPPSPMSPIPPPAQIIAPSSTGSSKPLEDLKLPPPSRTQPLTTTPLTTNPPPPKKTQPSLPPQIKELPESAIGYSNLEKFAKAKEEKPTKKPTRKRSEKSKP